MTLLKTTITTAITLGVGGLIAPASADVFTPRWPISELHSMQAGNTAGSYAASAVMGAQGYMNTSPPANWDSNITTTCTADTMAQGGSIWPASCNPNGMSPALNTYSVGSDWVTRQFLETDQASALALQLSAMQSTTLRSPTIAPIFGQADHWVVMTQITAQLVSGVWNIQQVKAFDGGPPTGVDSSFNAYESGQQAWGANTWKGFYFKVLTAINPGCDPNCTSDPFFGKFVLNYEPPPGQDAPPVAAAFLRGPGVLAPGQTMSALQAQAHVWDSLRSAAVDTDPSLWNAIRNGVPGTALAVNAVFPSGDAWDYYLVPILPTAHATSAIAFVQVSADDGSFDGIQLPSTTMPFTPVPMARAEQLAAGLLNRGETLGLGILTWNARTLTGFAKSPNRPYYEFPVLDADGKQVSLVWMPLYSEKPVRAP